MHSISKHVFPIVAWFVSVTTLLFNMPGGMSPDSVSQLHQARIDLFTDAHPPSMGLFWKFLDLLSAGPSGLLIVHSIILAAALYLLIDWLPCSRFAKAALFAVAMLWPGYFFIFGVVWKDIAMVVSVLAAFVMLFTRLTTPEAIRRDWFLTGLALFLLGYGMSVRHNAPPVIFGVLMVWLWQLMHRSGMIRRFLVSGLSAAGITLSLVAINAVASNAIVSQRSHFWQVMAVYDLAGISIRQSTSLMPPAVFPLGTYAEVKRYYTPRSVAPLTQESTAFPTLLEDGELKALRNAWLAAIVAHPKSYLSHKWAVLRQAMGLTKNEPWVAIYQQGIVQNDLGLPNIESKWPTKLRAKAYDWAFKGTLMFRPWAYALASLVLLGVALAATPLVAPMVVAFTFSGFLNAFSLFISAPAPDYRYSLWMVLGTVLSGVLIAGAALGGRARLLRPHAVSE